MGNRSSSAYPADHLASTRGGTSSSTSSATPASRGSSLPQDQTTCPQCQRVLLIPPNAPLFRCPCGVLFRTETLQQQQRHRSSLDRPGSGLLGPDGLMGRAVICRRCRRLSMLPQDGSGGSIAICRCGSPALPLNDVVMSLLAEGELGLLAGGRNGGSLSRRGEMEGASKDLIDVLPTCKFSAAAAQAASARATATANAAMAAPDVHTTTMVKREEDGEEEVGGEVLHPGAAAAAAATDAAWSSCLPSQGGEAAAPEEAAAAAVGPSPLPEKGKGSCGGRCGGKRGEPVSCLRRGGGGGGGGGKSASVVTRTSTEPNEKETLGLSKQLDSHNDDDLSCRICFEDYVDGDELRVLPCFHRFHAGCSFDWLSRKKTCPLCMTSIDVIMRRPEDLAMGEGEG